MDDPQLPSDNEPNADTQDPVNQSGDPAPGAPEATVSDPPAKPDSKASAETSADSASEATEIGPVLSAGSPAGPERGDGDDDGRRRPPSGRPDRRRDPPLPAGVRFRKAGKVYYFDARGFDGLVVGDSVIVESGRGRELGWVVIAPGQVVGAQLGEIKRILARASQADLANRQRWEDRCPEALTEARGLIGERELPMRAVLAEYNHDGSHVTIYFTSDETRVDFRDLVRDLSKVLRTRVHLRQIGPRDQAKLVGGIDRCGRELCCSSWMPDFQPITIRMAKNQNLPLNPSEISGVCGKLLCCLAFEDEQYTEFGRGLPRVGSTMTSAIGRGKVIDVNALTRKITVIWENGTRVEISAEELAEQQDRHHRLQEGGEDGASPPEAPPPPSSAPPPVAPPRTGRRR